MPRKVKDRSLDSREARSKLKVRGMPYYRALDRTLHLGYRRLKGKPGTWWARHYLGNEKYELEPIGAADDMSDADGRTILDFFQAQDRARKAMVKRSKTAVGTDGNPVTIGDALDRYKENLKVRKRSTENVQRVRSHVSEDLKNTPVGHLTTARLQRFRDGLLEDMKAASADRVCNAFRAALNLAADLSDGALNRSPWEIGLKSISGGSEPRNVVISETEIRRIVTEAYKEGEAFGLLVELAAVTGARVSQLARVLVRDLGTDLITIPSSRKGRTEGKMPNYTVPITTPLAARLRTASRGRGKMATLLFKPENDLDRKSDAWSKSDHSRPFARVVKRAKLDPDIVTIYALRHSSITRQLKANVPIRVVAAVHDTSVVMIEKTYSADIAKFSSDLVRPTLPDLGPKFGADNVVAF